ncbi:MAG: hydrogenase iron-sulfur subunit [Candidatus Helarchaeota archaeon]|nr:hydrogenase iron-sulfur subunit [Candidatus Helarchaeota archaeon]
MRLLEGLRLGFEPKILGFLCNWCSYAGADLAGVSRFQYPTNLRIIRVMCSGRVDPRFVINGLRKGLDGVIIMGCHFGDCHYLDGNYEAELKFKMLKKLLKFVNLDERLHLEWVSAAEGLRFSQVIKDFTEKIKALGPSPLSKKDIDPEFLEQIQAIEDVAKNYRVRAFVARERNLIENENVYGKKISEEEFNNIFDNALKLEYIRSRIYLLLKKKSMSVKNLSNYLYMESNQILNHILVLKLRGLVALDNVDGYSPLYTAIEV